MFLDNCRGGDNVNSFPPQHEHLCPVPAFCQTGSAASTIPTTNATTNVIVLLQILLPSPVRDKVKIYTEACDGRGSRNERDERSQRRISSSAAARVARTWQRQSSIAGTWRLGGIYETARQCAFWSPPLCVPCW